MAASYELQRAVFALLKASPEVGAIVGDRVYDGPPTAAALPYVSFGPSDMNEDDAECITGTVETLQVDCWARDGSNRLGPCRKLTRAVRRALHDAEVELPGPYALVSLSASTERVFMDDDGVTGHGVVTVEALVDEYDD